MNYYFSKILNLNFEEAETRIVDELKKVGFGILTEINVKETMKKKLDVDFKKYKVLGACNPNFAHQALTIEDKIGVLLPCSVIVQELENSTETEVAIMNPLEAMKAVANPKLEKLAIEVSEKLQQALENL